MRTLLSIIAFVSFAGFSQAADIVCSCKGTENKCSDVEINFVDSNPGVYMTIEYAYGERNREQQKQNLLGFFHRKHTR